MMTEHERQMCRDYKARLDAQETPAGALAAKLARDKITAQKQAEKILEAYKNPPLPEEPKVEVTENPILKMYMNK